MSEYIKTIFKNLHNSNEKILKTNKEIDNLRSQKMTDGIVHQINMKLVDKHISENEMQESIKALKGVHLWAFGFWFIGFRSTKKNLKK